VQSIEIAELSNRGKRLADAYQRSVQATKYIKDRWTTHSSVPAAVLKEFGSRAGLCEISKKGSDDREVIKEILFSCDREGTQSTHYRRRMSLLLLLHGIGKAATIETMFDRQTFSDLTYFKQVVTDEEHQESSPIDMPHSLRDVAERWRIFHFHSYLTVALQSLLVCVVGVLRHHPAGIDRSRLLDEFQVPALSARFSRLFKTKLPGSFFELTPGALLGLTGVKVADAIAGKPSALASLSIGSKFAERDLVDQLTEGEAQQISGIAVATILLYVVLLRYQTSVEPAYDAWYQNLVQDRFADLSVPGVLGTLRSEYGDDWWQRPNREILNLLLWRFVLLQHQTMSYERGFGGSAPLFHLDGTTIIGTDADFSEPGALNARFFSAVQILRDLKLVAGNYDDGFQLTAEGNAWLQRLLAEEAPS